MHHILTYLACAKARGGDSHSLWNTESRDERNERVLTTTNITKQTKDIPGVFSSSANVVFTVRRNSVMGPLALTFKSFLQSFELTMSNESVSFKIQVIPSENN